MIDGAADLLAALGEGSSRTAKRRIEEVQVPVVVRSFPRWAGEPPGPTYQPYNKGYWIDDGGTPGFGETAIARILNAAGSRWTARWAPPAFGKLNYRLNAMKMTRAEKAEVRPPAEVVSVLERLQRCVASEAKRLGRPEWGGGCWDVVAWRGDGHLAFVEAKQLSETWEDALRPSQRLWVRCARAATEPMSFALVEWSVAAAGSSVLGVRSPEEPKE